MAIAGQYGDEVLQLLEEHSLLNYFEHHFTQDDFAITKPDPRYFEQIAHQAGARPDECLMVGDRIDKDIIPAKQLGMKTIRVRWGLHSIQEPRVPSEIPDMEIARIELLSEAIDTIAE
jgi:FMN phosphatase YigB (HAD superfamily)